SERIGLSGAFGRFAILAVAFSVPTAEQVSSPADSNHGALPPVPPEPRRRNASYRRALADATGWNTPRGRGTVTTPSTEAVTTRSMGRQPSAMAPFIPLPALRYNMEQHDPIAALGRGNAPDGRGRVSPAHGRRAGTRQRPGNALRLCGW